MGEFLDDESAVPEESSGVLDEGDAGEQESDDYEHDEHV